MERKSIERAVDEILPAGAQPGSDANETVARAVIAATGRPRIISFTGAYHGGTAGSMAVSAHSVQGHADKAGGLVSLAYPDPYRLGGQHRDGGAILQTLCEGFDADVPPAQVAAMFIEPIQSDGGLAVGVELVETRDGKGPATQAAAKTVYRAFELGLVHYYVGMNSNVLEMTPPLNLSRGQVDEAVDILDRAISDVVAARVPDSVLEGFEGW